MRYALCALLTLVAALAATHARAAVLIDDAFDDGDPKTNTLGVGGRYNGGLWNGSMTEAGGILTFNLTGDWGNGGLVSYEDDTPEWDGRFDAWTPDGVTATAVLGGVTHTNVGEALNATFGIVDERNKGDNQADALVPYHNREGGLWLRLAFNKTGPGDADFAVYGAIVAAAADKDSDGTGAALVDNLATFALPDWDGQAFRTFQIFVNDTGWRAAAPGGAVVWTDGFTGATSTDVAYGQTWATVNASAGFTNDDPADDADWLDDTVFGHAVANLGLDGARDDGTVDYDHWRVETGDMLAPEPATLSLLALGALALLRRR